MKSIVNILMVLLLLGHCAKAFKDKTPTRKQAIQQTILLKELESKEQTEKTIYLIDSIKRINNKYRQQ